MMSIPAPLQFQYLTCSTIFFLPAVLHSTEIAARPLMPERFSISKVRRELAGTVFNGFHL